MTSDTRIDDAFPGDPPADLPPFERWVETARPKTQLWRTLLGLVIIVVISQLVVLLAGLGFAVYVIMGQGSLNEGARQAIEDLLDGKTIPGAMFVLASFAGLWLGVWVALRLLHGKQKFFSLVSPERKIRWKEFGIGAGIMAIYLAISVAVGMLVSSGSGYRSDIEIGTWAMILLPMAILTFVQACGEELAFRGYLMQHLAARFSHPLVWGFLPAAIFGAIHWFNGTYFEYSLYYTLDTILFGLIAAVTVWRTGSIAMAMGIHWINNFAGFTLSGTDDFMTATPLYLDSVENAMKGAPYGIVMMVLFLGFVLSPWAPMPKRQLFRRKETRAAP